MEKWKTQRRKERAAKDKRKLREAESRAEARAAAKAEKDACREKVMLAEAAEAAKASATAVAEEAAAAPAQEIAKPKQVAKKKRKVARKKMPQEGNVVRSGIFDAEGAERDAMLIKQLGSRLGIGGSDPDKRRRVERSIFTDLGLNDDLNVGVEEPPSSGDEADHAASGAEREFGELLDDLLRVAQ